MNNITQRLLVLLCGIAISCAALMAQDWPQWRGPSRTGAAVGVTWPATFPDRPKQVWKVQIGQGHSSPVVAGGRVYLFSRVGEQEAVSAREQGGLARGI